MNDFSGGDIFTSKARVSDVLTNTTGWNVDITNSSLYGPISPTVSIDDLMNSNRSFTANWAKESMIGPNATIWCISTPDKNDGGLNSLFDFTSTGV